MRKTNPLQPTPPVKIGSGGRLHMALPGTAHAIGQGIDGLAGSADKLAAVVQFQVGRPK